MRALIACEFSGMVRDAFLARGHEAWSCDLEPSEAPGPHIRGNVLQVVREGWDLMVAFPPCTYLSRAGARWWRDEERQKKAHAAAAFVFALRDAPIERICIENPIGQLNQRWRYPDQIIQPYHYGAPYSKRTCLWLKNLPPLFVTKHLEAHTPLLPSNVGLGKRLGQKSHPGHVSGGKEASRTFPGVAAAMAEQWGDSAVRGREWFPLEALK